MVSYGFNFGTSSVGEVGVKVAQKWRYLETNNYNQYNNKFANQTGCQGGKAKPFLYDVIHAIKSPQHSTEPLRLIDSGDGVPKPSTSYASPGPSSAPRRPFKVFREKRAAAEAAEDENCVDDEEEADGSSNKSVKSPFHSVKKKTNPKKKKGDDKGDIITEIRNLAAMEEKKWNDMKELFQTASEQKAAMIDILSKALLPQGPKPVGKEN